MTYREMASLYDQLMVNAPYDQWVDFTEHIFEKSGKQIKSIADYGCGTGEITLRLANKGYQTYGIDYSADMLAFAQKKSSDEKLSVQWIQQDLREIEGLNNLDAAVSYCDVINYITSEKDLAKVFRNIAGSLKSGGLFLFDVHSVNYVEDHLVNQTFTEVTDDIAYIWHCFDGEELGEMHHELTFFSIDEDGKYNRFDEFHHQRTYSINFYKQLLKNAGFEKLKVYRDFSTINEKQIENTERIFFIAEKGRE